MDVYDKKGRFNQSGGTVTLKITLLTSDEEHERYVSRLRWICYAIVRKQCQAILYHTTMAERLLATYRSKLALPKNIQETKCAAIEQKLFSELYEPRGITEHRIDDVLKKLEKRSNVLGSAAKELSRELEDEMLGYDPSKWADKNYIEPQFTFIKWHDLLSVIAMEEALVAINQGYCALRKNLNRNADEYAKTIKNYLGVFTDRGWSPDEDENNDEALLDVNVLTAKSPKRIPVKKFQQVKEQIDKFIEPNFINALKKAIPKRDIVERVYEDKDRTISVNNIAALLRLYGYNDEDMKMGWMGNAVLPIFLVHAPKELFEEVFPLLELYDDYDLTPFTEDNYYSKLILPHKEQWLPTLLAIPYNEDLCGLDVYSSKLIERTLTNALHGKSIVEVEQDIERQKRANEEEKDERMEHVHEHLLPELYKEYPELEEYLSELAGGDFELMQMLNL